MKTLAPESLEIAPSTINWKISRILIPVDFSETSLNALNYGVELAAVLKAKIVLFNSYRVTAPVGVESPPIEYMQSLILEDKRNQQEKLQALVNRYLAQLKSEHKNIEFSTVVKHGFAIDNIALEATTGDYDLVIMGTKGASGLNEILWGSITSRIVEKIKLPVLVVPGQAKFQGLQHVVYATNYDEHDTQALHQLAVLTSQFDGKTTCLHVSRETDSEEEDATRALLLAEIAADAAIDFEEVSNKDVEKGIEDYLEVHTTNLLAVMPQQKGLIRDFFRSSVSKKLTQHAKIPVMVLK